MLKFIFVYLFGLKIITIFATSFTCESVSKVKNNHKTKKNEGNRGVWRAQDARKDF